MASFPRKLQFWWSSKNHKCLVSPQKATFLGSKLVKSSLSLENDDLFTDLWVLFRENCNLGGVQKTINVLLVLKMSLFCVLSTATKSNFSFFEARKLIFTLKKNQRKKT